MESGGPHWLAVANSASYAGGFGVDLFFVLSAYLITELLLREKSQCGTLDVKAFYLRRVLRIWPLYFFYIGIALIPAFNPVKEFSWRYVLAFLLLAGNWSILLWGWPHSIINPLWTVSVEEQFYLLWPPLVRNIPRNKIIFAAVGMLVVSTVTRILLVAFHAGTDSVRCNTLGRLDPIAAGILIAAMLHRAPNFSNGLRLGMLSCGVLPAGPSGTLLENSRPPVSDVDSHAGRLPRCGSQLYPHPACRPGGFRPVSPDIDVPRENFVRPLRIQCTSSVFSKQVDSVA